MAGVLQRLLTRSGLLPVLRSQWRADQSAAAEKLETRLDKRVAELKAQVDRVADLADRLKGLEAIADSVERITNVDREVRMLRATLAGDIADRHKGPHRPGVFDADRVAPHVARAIASAPLQTDPSVHIVINDLMPPDTYAALLEGIPPRIFFSQRDNAKQNIRLSQLDVAPEWTLQTLAFLENVLIPKMMVPALLKTLEPHIREFYIREYGAGLGPALAAIPHEATSGRLMLRRPGYHLDPHLDPKRVVFTTLLYFARPGDSEAFGTSFYRMSGTPNIDRTTTFYPETQGITCDLVKMVPFKPNSAVAFLNWGGAHGADIPKSAPAETERYSYQFYVSPDPAALARHVGETESAVAE
ncbi:MAG: hypothetical protein DMF87_17870 [Acidobacteria bacterium]|nr:MAG: hypothetical protein DMF87_17870 [Acidobacteriota bacterium]